MENYKYYIHSAHNCQAERRKTGRFDEKTELLRRKWVEKQLFCIQRCTRPEALPPTRASTSFSEARLKSNSVACLRQLAATAYSI